MIRAVAIPVAPAVGFAVEVGDPSKRVPQQFYSGSYIEESDSWRILEWTRYDDPEAARRRAEEILDAGFSVAKLSTENEPFNQLENPEMKTLDQNPFEAPTLQPGKFYGHLEGGNLDAEQFLRGHDWGLILGGLSELTTVCPGSSLRAGWWHNPETGEPVGSVPEKLMLIVSEISEAMEADRKGLRDDKLPARAGVEVELADAVIRIFDLAGALGLDLPKALREKMVFNARRPDHKPENRAAAGGKAY